MKTLILKCRQGRGVIGRASRIAGLLCAAWALPAVAQQTIAPPDDAKPIPQWVCLIIFTVFVVAIAYRNPKRTHKS